MYMKKGFKKLAVGSAVLAGAAALASAVSYFVTKNLLTVALDRKEPKAIGKSKEILTGNPNIEETAKLQKKIAERLENEPLEDVEIVADDGTKLIGHFHRAQNAKRTIIAMHGWRSSFSKDFGMIADFWFENDCNVLFAEQRGQGKSGGEYMGFGLVERFDTLCWIDWVNSRIDNSLPIYLAGISMGATTVLMASGEKLSPNVKGVMADCGFTSPEAIWKHVAKNMHLRYNELMGYWASNICKRKINFGANDYSTIEAMKNTDIPVLFVHGTEDKFVPIEMTYENYVACVSPKRLLVVPGAQHGMSYFTEKANYEKAIKDFWKDFD